MTLRAPATPLITSDPYFSVWSFSDKLNDSDTVHWTGSPNTINGTVTVDGKKYRFIGKGISKSIEQISSRVSALVTDYSFANSLIALNVSFYTPLFTDDLYRLSRPVSYMDIRYGSADGQKHDVTVSIEASEELCLNKAGDDEVTAQPVKLAGGLTAVKMGSRAQKTLTRCGDDLRIEWGYFYIAGPLKAAPTVAFSGGRTFAGTTFPLTEGETQTVLFGYDDIYCLEYFNEPVRAYWKKSGKTIEEALSEAYGERAAILEKCRAFSKELREKAEEAGGEKYADLLSLAYRQVIAGHKLAVDKDGNNIFISKECFSNGCTATVDVTYPSAPLFLLYNTELLKGTLRPIFRYAASDDWNFDFAPHDAGTYPLVNGQKYASDRKDDPERYLAGQMPVEECGNMLILMAAIAMKDGNTDFADPYADVLAQWVRYLIKYGEDPENQLCTDDFAGHLAHNCNLSIKAIMGVAGYAKLLGMKGDADGCREYMQTAKKMAESWTRRAANGDGSYRLAFDKPGSFSMKYNIIWDKLWNTGLFPEDVFRTEFASYKQHINAFGLPLDNRETYTKSDWLVWTACLADSKEEFEKFILPLWNAYDKTESRVPMTDWYWTKDAKVVGFRARTVQGGLFIKLLTF